MNFDESTSVITRIVRGWRFRRTARRLFSAMESDLGPLVWHDHANGYAACRACQIGHPYAPHYPGCGCGHCPDPETSRQLVLRDLTTRDAYWHYVAPRSRRKR